MQPKRLKEIQAEYRLEDARIDMQNKFVWMRQVEGTKQPNPLGGFLVIAIAFILMALLVYSIPELNNFINTIRKH